MKAALLAVVCSLSLAAAGSFQNPKAKDAQERYSIAVRRADDDRERALAAAAKQYIASLQQALAQTTRAGDLDDANVIKAELERLQQPWHTGAWTIRYTNSVVKDLVFTADAVEVYDRGQKLNTFPYQVKDGVVVIDEGPTTKRLSLTGEKLLVESFVGNTPEDLYGVGVRRR